MVRMLDFNFPEVYEVKPLLNFYEKKLQGQEAVYTQLKVRLAIPMIIYPNKEEISKFLKESVHIYVICPFDILHKMLVAWLSLVLMPRTSMQVSTIYCIFVAEQ